MIVILVLGVLIVVGNVLVAIEAGAIGLGHHLVVALGLV